MSRYWTVACCLLLVVTLGPIAEGTAGRALAVDDGVPIDSVAPPPPPIAPTAALSDEEIDRQFALLHGAPEAVEAAARSALERVDLRHYERNARHVLKCAAGRGPARYLAREKLRELKRKAVPVLLEGIRGASDQERRAALEALGDMVKSLATDGGPNAEIVSAAIDLLGSEKASGAWRIVAVLRKEPGAAKAIPILERQLAEALRNEYLPLHTARALLLMCDQRHAEAHKVVEAYKATYRAHQAAMTGDLPRLRQWMAAGVRINSKRDVWWEPRDDGDWQFRLYSDFFDGKTMLMVAAHRGHRDVVEYLIQEGADIDVEIDGFNALGLAEKAGRAEIAALLRKHGAKRSKPEKTPR